MVILETPSFKEVPVKSSVYQYVRGFDLKKVEKVRKRKQVKPESKVKYDANAHKTFLKSGGKKSIAPIGGFVSKVMYQT